MPSSKTNQSVSYLIYKPFGMLSQFTKEVKHHVTLADLDFVFPKDVYPVGRLDADSEGLLLLSNDKRLNAKLLHPKNKEAKVYYVQVEGSPTEEAINRLEKGVSIRIKGKEFRTAPSKVFILKEVSLSERIPPIRYRATIPDTWLSVTITEGKNRQVRRMLAAVGFPVLRLVRVGIANFQLGIGVAKDLRAGECIEVEL